MNPFQNLTWYKMSTTLSCEWVAGSQKEHILVVIESIIKETFHKSPDFKEQKILFHIKNRPLYKQLKKGEKFYIDFLFFKTTGKTVKKWKDKFLHHFEEIPKEISIDAFNRDILRHLSSENDRLFLHQYYQTQGTDYLGLKKDIPEEIHYSIYTILLKAGYYKNNYTVRECSQIEERSFKKLTGEFPEMQSKGEICLDFKTPCSFKRETGRKREYLTKEILIRTLQNRIEYLFGTAIPYEPHEDDFEILPYYWEYREIKHLSKSHRPNKMYINGCLGKLYIKGNFKNFLPYIILSSEIHCANKYPFSVGYYTLHSEPVPSLTLSFFNTRLLHGAVHKISYNNDSVARHFTEGTFNFNEEQFVENLLNDLVKNRYLPLPHKAFTISKKNGNDRLVEILPYKELLIHSALNTLLYKPFEIIFENCSIGFRKGKSPEAINSIIQKAVAEKYEYVVETDIQDFFPSISLDLMMKVLQHYLPDSDWKVVNLIEKLIHTGYTFKDGLHERKLGLPQGSPLSPLLTNLYLTQFDKAFANDSSILIRFADDLIILTRTREEAIEALDKIKDLLHSLQLTINPEKTAIHRIEEGFQFLGKYIDSSISEYEEGKAVQPYRKVLYITHPFAFLSVYGECLEIKEGKTITATIPFRRISEIVILQQVTFSTILIKKCRDYGITITTTLQSGYKNAIIKQDDKRHYDLIVQHSAKVGSLKEKEMLTLGKKLIEAKIKNYIFLFEKKYVQGSNQVMNTLEQYLQKSRKANSVESLRGYEGKSAREIYKGLNRLIKNPAFHIKKRDRKIKDPINTVMNLSYYLLFSRLNGLVRGAGLNPFMGIVHSKEDRYESFVCDLEEPFRARIDKIIIKAVNLKILDETDFIDTDKRMEIKKDKLTAYLQFYEKELESVPKNEKLSIHDLLKVQVVNIKKWINENKELTFYHWKDAK